MTFEEKNKILEYENKKLTSENEDLKKKLEVLTKHSPNILVDTLSFTTQEYVGLCQELGTYKEMYNDLNEEMLKIRKSYEEQFEELLNSIEGE